MSLDKMLEEAARVPEKRHDFEIELVTSNIYVIGKKNPEYNLFTIKNKDGSTVVPFFTSIAKLEYFGSQMAKGNVPYIEMPCLDFFAMVRDSNAYLNPNTEVGKLFTSEEMKKFLNSGLRSKNDDFRKGVPFMAGQPKVYPHELVEALKKAFEKMSRVNKAYLFQVAYGTIKPHIMLVIDFEGEKGLLFDDIGNVAKNYISSDDLLDAIPATDNLAIDLIKKAEPFYVKK